MSQKVFIPVTDEMLYERPELITAPLRPYRIDEPCFHWLAVEIEEVDAAARESLDIVNEPVACAPVADWFVELCKDAA